MRCDLTWCTLVTGPGFLALAAWFVFGPSPARLPDLRGGGALVFGATRAPRRSMLSDPPLIEANGYLRPCSECHRLVEPLPIDPLPTLHQHSHIHLDHGDLIRCRGCHQVRDRDFLRLEDGARLPFSASNRQCAECHLARFEQWQRGTHGRLEGRWDAPPGEAQRLFCVECHDPHQPRRPVLEPARPLAGPRTLRMGSVPRPAEWSR